jgi:zinc transporter ZupT
MLSSARRNIAAATPFSAGILVGVMAFGVLPEIVAEIGWSAALALFACGYLLLFGINARIYPVCPTCADTHNHTECATLLHGFAGPLVLAAALHSFLDGWTLAAAPPQSGPVFSLAIAFHKIAEGIALGALLAASVRARGSAIALVVVAESPTLGGAALAIVLAHQWGVSWTLYPLAVAAGSLLFLGSHAIHNEWKQRGPGRAVTPALLGAGGAAVMKFYAALLRF